MLKKPDRHNTAGHTISCFLAGFGFAVFDANPRVNYAGAVSAAHQSENAAEGGTEIL